MPGEMIEYASNGDSAHAYLATPESASGPGVIVLQEWWGLVEHIKEIADRFAQQGFVALAPDLYHGESTDHPDDAGRMMMALNIERTEKDLRGAIEALAARDETRGTKVGTVGFCMGGQLSLYAACKNPAVGACVDYYGIHPAVSLDFVGLEAPVLGFFGETDAFVTPEAAQQLEADLVAADKRVEIHVYPAGHAFFNDSRPDAYDEHFAEESWERMIAFYREHLD
ncbi:MAG: dienelactone hydrolase family protein [Acidobacteriota bacterium]|nr:dienelactone hydrolase family protein [Acidobacteriota bacterium]